MRRRDRYGMYSAITVLTSDNPSTNTSRRQYGVTYASARRRSVSSNFNGYLCVVGARGNDDHVRHVRAQIDRAEVGESVGGVAVDRAAGGRDVELTAVRAHDEPHARAARELRLAEHAMRLEVERPELVVADFVVDAVRALAIGRQAEAHADARSERVEVELPIDEIHSRDAHLGATVDRDRWCETVRCRSPAPRTRRTESRTRCDRVLPRTASSRSPSDRLP